MSWTGALLDVCGVANGDDLAGGIANGDDLGLELASDSRQKQMERRERATKGTVVKGSGSKEIRMKGNDQ
ncbi:MAG: hypothetical protein C5B49_00820 [Bdellovibrio sp.]|nr:MAG: hypothetical protein C5B49_00820 [Bdellovibrio sp.]